MLGDASLDVLHDDICLPMACVLPPVHDMDRRFAHYLPPTAMPPRPGYFPAPQEYRPYYDSAPPVPPSLSQAAGPRQPQKRKRHGKRNGHAAKRRRGGLQGNASAPRPRSFEVQAARKPWYHSRSRPYRAEPAASRFPAARAETPSTIPRTTPRAPYNSSSFLLQRESLIPLIRTRSPRMVASCGTPASARWEHQPCWIAC